MNLDDLIAAERSAPAEATQAQSAELWRSIERSFVSGPIVGAPLGAAKASTLGKIGGALSSTAGKLLLATTLVTGGVVGANSVLPSDEAATAAVSVASPIPAPSSPPLAIPNPAPDLAPAPVSAPVLQPLQVAAPAEPPTPELKPAKARPAAKPKATVQDELALIRRTQSAVRTGAHGRALTLARQHAATYPDGAFVEDREALRALALCESGNAKASGAASKFVERWPKSMHRSRIEAACE